MTTTDRAALIDQLILHEGKSLHVYLDSLGIESIGVGRNLRDPGITNAEAIYLLNNDIDVCIRDLTSFAWFPVLDPVRQRAICDLRFNLGPARFGVSRQMIAALERHDFEAAAGELLESRWATQVQASRRDRLVAMLRTGVA